MRRAPVVSVVIITRNEGVQLKATVESVYESLPRRTRELIVVDDGSTDNSTRFLRHYPEARCLRTNGVGVARARNHGAAKATGDIILFCDAHMRAPAGWHRRLFDPLGEPGVGAVAPGIYSLDEPGRRGYGLYFSGPDLHARWLARPGPKPTRAPILPGCFLAMRRQVFDATGGFDPSMRQLGGNDNELSLRFWLSGYELLIVPTIDVGHLFRTTIPFDATWAAVVHNRLRTAFIHFGEGRIQRVVEALRAYASFPAGLAMIVEADVFERRQRLGRDRRRKDDWYFRTFGMRC